MRPARALPVLAAATPLLLSLAAIAPAARSASAAGPVRIWALGDSITVGVTATVPNGYTPGGYRGYLHDLLTQDGAAHLLIGTSTENSSTTLDADGQAGHDGHSGYRIDQVDTDLDGIAGGRSDNGGQWMTGLPSRAPVAPEIVIIHLGTNDIAQNYDPQTRFPNANGSVNRKDGGQVATFDRDMTTRLQHLVERIESLAPGTKIVLSDIIPITTTVTDTMTPPYAEDVRALAASEQAAGLPLVFADVHAAFMKQTAQGPVVRPGVMGPDGVHPSPTGYKLMAATYQAAVERLLGG